MTKKILPKLLCVSTIADFALGNTTDAKDINVFHKHIQVPCYSYGQKLSKLAILRIACNYILSLARLADLDYSADHSNMSFSECVEQCTRTLQAEGRSKKRKFKDQQRHKRGDWGPCDSGGFGLGHEAAIAG
ncbi:Atoh8 [Columba livia]|nr:Atoh8 [Columba livia]